jgi:carboxylate-amine ligase
VGEARAELRRLRGTVGEIAGRYGMRLLACSTHPFSTWEEQRSTEASRYRKLADDYQAVVRRNLICGMHVHAGIADDEERIRLMNGVVPYLPVLLALSTSSPFWRGHETGLKAFRPTICGELPRTGLPDTLAGWAGWQELLAILADTELCPDPTKIWWDIRPSAKHPTLEVRLAEACTRLEDALTIAALYQCLLGYLIRVPPACEDWHRFQRMLAEENKWRAQRWGCEAHLADFDRRRLVPFADLLDGLLEQLAPEIERFGCAEEAAHARTILQRGTSADRQLAIYRERLTDGASEDEALRAVVAWIAETTLDLG